MNRKNKIKAIVALAVALAFIMPGAAVVANVDTIGVTSNSENTGDMENIVEISTNSDTSDNAMPLGATIYVGNGGYSTIQEGINAASPGDTVYVYNGIYNECDMLVDKSLNLVGESKEGVIVDSTGSATIGCFKFLQGNTDISNFTMKNGLMSIWVDSQGTDIEHINITNCIMHDTQYYGIMTMGGLGYMKNSVIKNCEVYNTMRGISLGNFFDNTISECNFHDNDYGIYMAGNVYNTRIYHNNFIGNTQNAYPLNTGPGAIWDNDYPSGGNYWDDYTGVDEYHGPNQDILGSDKIGDTPYVLDADEQDNYPLIYEWPPEEIKYILNITVDPPAGGTVDVNPAGPYTNGTEVTLTPNANTGWSFADWSGPDGSSVVDNKINMTKNMSITATFTPEEYNLTISIAGQGSVDVNPAGPSYTYGTEVTLTPNANTGWSFADWSGPDGSSVVDNKINMTKDMNVTATFTPEEYNLTITIAGQGSVDVNPAGPSYTYGTEVTLTPNANTGWSFADWSGPDGSSVVDNKINMTKDMNVTATFTKGWELPMTFTGDVLGSDTVVFGETADASNGIDPTDLVKPDAPPAPYIYAYLKTDLPAPYDILWEEYRFYDADNDLQIWDLFVETDTAGGPETVTVTIVWDNTVLAGETQYEHIGLYDVLSGDLLEDMKAVGTYIFTADSGMANHFQIICSDNHAPVAVPDSYETMEAHELIVAAPGVLLNDFDVDGDLLTAVVPPETGVSSGILTLFTDGSFEYEPNLGFSGTDSFTYKACDGELYSNIVTVTIEVKKLNHISLQDGWNLISMPVGESIDKTDILVRNNSVDYTWDDAITEGIILDPTFGWNSGMYTDETTLVPGEGYWMWSYQDCELLIPSNVEADNHITNLAVAWNLVGIPYDTSLEKTGINVYYNGDLYTWDEAVNASIILDPLFDWDRTSQNYADTDTFMPGYGYWIYAYHGCALKKA